MGSSVASPFAVRTTCRHGTQLWLAHSRNFRHTCPLPTPPRNLRSRPSTLKTRYFNELWSWLGCRTTSSAENSHVLEALDHCQCDSCKTIELPIDISQAEL